MSESSNRTSNPTPACPTVVFDLGQVVLRWKPERAFAKVLPDGEVSGFMDEIGFHDWNRELDAGAPIDRMESDLVHRLPHHREAIEAYRTHFEAAITGMVPGTGAVIAELQAAGVRLLALTNWSSDLFNPTRRRFGLLKRFEGIVVSGEEKISKPDPKLFHVLFERYGVDPGRAVFIDDSEPNCRASESLGMQAIRFADADLTRSRLVELGLLTPRSLPTEAIFHLAKRKHWNSALASDCYGWSSRSATYEAEGYVHLCYAAQVPGVIERFYADLAPDDMVALELDPHTVGPVVTEDLHGAGAFPHLYARLRAEAVVAEHPVASLAT